MSSLLAQQINSVLPQTQCRQCGFDGCQEYAHALAQGKAQINRCAPGGRRGIAQLAAILQTPVIELDPEYGKELPLALARINPQVCIGCALCAVACPVEVISGVPKHLFAVIEEQCTGCGLCVYACPVNAIRMHEVSRQWTQEDARRARTAYNAACDRRKAAKTARLQSMTQGASMKNSILADVLKRAQALGAGKSHE